MRQYGTNRNHQARRCFVERGFAAAGIAGAQRLDDSPIQIAQPRGHNQMDQFGAALSKIKTRMSLFVHVVHSPPLWIYIPILCEDFFCMRQLAD
jgi:hypothetical protein